ncbi:hypothetical protein DL767_008957 [Monosporascus sp. MG133]|nr:hypothetical protein DL767_008957 [Monosporascus sp. MG133]
MHAISFIPPSAFRWLWDPKRLKEGTGSRTPRTRKAYQAKKILPGHMSSFAGDSAVQLMKDIKGQASKVRKMVSFGRLKGPTPSSRGGSQRSGFYEEHLRRIANNDNKVVSLLDEIRKYLPRLETWESIYPTDTMRRLVVTTYLRITEFLKKAAEYFTHFRKRLKLALFPGFVTGFDEIGADIRTTLAEINDEAMYGLHREVHSSGKRQEYLKDRADKAELAHQKLLAQNRELLAQNDSLMAHGCTEWYGRHETGFLHCWLSPFAIYIAEDASQMDKTRVAFFSCLPREQPEPVNISMVFASIILQVIHWQPELLREHDDQFRRILQRADKSWSAESLANLLGMVLSQLNSEAFRAVYIVIDRLDCCLSDNLSQGMMYLSSMITELKGSPVSVKLLVIAETSEGNAEWHSEGLPRFKFDLERLIVRHDWDQQQLPSWMSATETRPRIWSSGSAPCATTF